MKRNPIFPPAIVVCLTVVLLRASIPVAAWQQPTEPNEPAEQYILCKKYCEGSGLVREWLEKESVRTKEDQEVPRRVLTAAQSEDESHVRVLYRRALVQASLGRIARSNELLSQAIELKPDYADARLQRGDWEDYLYLVDNNSRLSPTPYFAVAKRFLLNGKPSEAEELLKKTTSLFPDRGVVSVDFLLSPNDLDMDTVLSSLTLRGVFKQKSLPWNVPPYMLGPRIARVGNTVFTDMRMGLDFNSFSEHVLEFNRFGFEQARVEFPDSEFSPGTILRKEIEIKRTKRPVRRSTLTGRARLAGQSSHSGISVEVYDKWEKNTGFGKQSVTDQEGFFAVSHIPDGKFEVKYDADGYVPRTITIEVFSRAYLGPELSQVKCFIDSRGEYDPVGITPCDLSAIGIHLYKARTVRVKWTLQERPNELQFVDHISQGEAILTSALPDDWTRGNWSCCGASYKFGIRSVDKSFDIDPAQRFVQGGTTFPDVVIFTSLDGRIYFGQPHAASVMLGGAPGWITRVDRDYDELLRIEGDTQFNTREEVTEGTTYVLKTNRGRGILGSKIYFKLKGHTRFLVKMKVLEVGDCDHQ